MLTGFTLAGIAIWLLLYDMVRKSIRNAGIHRFSALSLIFGYSWLANSGILYMANGSGSIAIKVTLIIAIPLIPALDNPITKAAKKLRIHDTRALFPLRFRPGEG